MEMKNNLRFAVDTFSFHLNFGKHWFKPSSPCKLKWYCETSKRLGASGLHIDPYHIDLENDTDWLREFASQNGMYIELGACGTFSEILKPSIQAASRLGSKVLRTFTGGNCSEGRKATAKAARKAAGELVESTKIAEDYGVVLALENHFDIFLEDFVFLMENVDSAYLGICYDSGNFAACGEDVLRAFEMLKDKIICTHLKDVCPVGRYPDADPVGLSDAKCHFCALGEGTLPIKEIISKIIEHRGANFNFTIEIHSPFRKSLTEEELLKFEYENIEKSVKFIKNNVFCI